MFGEQTFAQPVKNGLTAGCPPNQEESSDQVSRAPTWVHFHELVRQFVSDLLKPFLVTLLLSRYQVVVDTPTLVGTLDHLHSDQGCDSKVGTFDHPHSDQGCDSKVGTLDHPHSDQGCDSKVANMYENLRSPTQ